VSDGLGGSNKHMNGRYLPDEVEPVELPRSRTSARLLANNLLTATRIRSDDTASFALPPSGAAAPADLDGELGLYS